MGRTKIKMEKLKTARERQATFNKRRRGLTKKVRDLSILCETDLMAVMFAPNGKPVLCLGEHSDLAAILERFERVDEVEREKRKYDILEILKRLLNKDGNDIDIDEDFKERKRKEDAYRRLQLLKATLADVTQRLSYWENPENVNNLDQIKKMEETVENSLKQLGEHKKLLLSQSSEQVAPGFPSPGFNCAVAQGELMQFADPGVPKENAELEMPFSIPHPPIQNMNLTFTGLNQSQTFTHPNVAQTFTNLNIAQTFTGLNQPTFTGPNHLAEASLFPYYMD